MIDLDAIKAAGLNSDAVSVRMLADHEYRQRIELLAAMVQEHRRCHPEATDNDIEQYRLRAAVEVGL